MVVKKSKIHTSFFRGLPYNQTFGVGRLTKFTTPSFNNLFDIKPGKIDKELKNMFKSKNKPNKLFGDWDKDGVLNFNDCKPKNPKKHGGEFFWNKIKEKGIVLGPNKFENKKIRRIYEKNPELLKKSKNLFIMVGNEEDFKNNSVNDAVYQEPSKQSHKQIKSQVPSYKGSGDILAIRDISFTSEDINPARQLRHELTHREQYQRDPKYYREEQERYFEEEDRITEKRDRSFRNIKQQFDQGKLSREEAKATQQKAVDTYYEEYKNLPLEKEAYEAEEAIPVRNIPVPKQKRYIAYQNLMGDNDGDGTPNILDKNPEDKNER